MSADITPYGGIPVVPSENIRITPSENIQITPRRLRGNVTPPGSKSMGHRLLIGAALSDGESMVRGVSMSEDIAATLRCVTALGRQWTIDGETVRISGNRRPPTGVKSNDMPVFDCGESGSTLRFFIPIALACMGGGIFTGHGRLLQRPQEPYRELFRERGIVFDPRGDSLTVRGTLHPGEYALRGDVSSQFVTGLLYALALLDRESHIRLTTPLQSRGYVDMTVDALKQFGVMVKHLSSIAPESFPDAAPEVFPDASPEVFIVPGGQRCQARETVVEGDWSQAAFWYAAKFTGAQVTISGLNPQSVQGDRVITALYERLTAPGEVEMDVSDCPDLLPPLCVMAAVRSGVTRFVKAGRLRMKESDRLDALDTLLRTFGVRVQTGPDTLTVRGGLFADGPAPTEITVDGAKDHRIVMAAAILAAVSPIPVTLVGAQAVDKSYPDFFTHYRQLGGMIDVV